MVEASLLYGGEQSIVIVMGGRGEECGSEIKSQAAPHSPAGEMLLGGRGISVIW